VASLLHFGDGETHRAKLILGHDESKRLGVLQW
jgi:hypothetical protein